MRGVAVCAALCRAASGCSSRKSALPAVLIGNHNHDPLLSRRCDRHPTPSLRHVFRPAEGAWGGVAGAVEASGGVCGGEVIAEEASCAEHR
eukprot:790288-Rhodomonas_salina.1